MESKRVGTRMEISIFDVVGPVMIGPSSSHTAGAAKLARVAKTIVAKPFKKVRFGLHGSFAMTYKGHGTDRALVAGVLGLREDDEALANSFEIAKEQGLQYEFYKITLENVHENTVKITFILEDEKEFNVTGSSIGGGQIRITDINGNKTDFSAQYSTILISHHDRKGIISDVSTILADECINIATMRLSRNARGEQAFCIIETDDRIPEEIKDKLEEMDDIYDVEVINIEEE